MNHGSLYSGIGGWLLAARWAGIENVFTCEIDDFCNKIIKKHFEVEQHRDIKEFNGEGYAGRIDILSTSDPCQPFSSSGAKAGKADDRYLWPQTIRVVREIKPPYVVFENVFGFINMAFETVASDLEAEGYTVESFIIPACAVGAWHRRDRLWIIAHSHSNKRGAVSTRSNTKSNRRDNSIGMGKIIPDTKQKRSRHRIDPGLGREQKLDKKLFGMEWDAEPELDRVVHGVSSELDKNRRESLGNSIVPQIAYIIFEAIKEVNHGRQNQNTQESASRTR